MTTDNALARALRADHPSDQEDIIDLRAIAKLMWGGKWIILICGLFGLAIWRRRR